MLGGFGEIGRLGQLQTGVFHPRFVRNPRLFGGVRRISGVLGDVGRFRGRNRLRRALLVVDVRMLSLRDALGAEL